jgi:GNAT superfamily N-acetyltransferase
MAPSDVFELRLAQAGDAAAIRTLTRQAYAKWVPIIGREPLPMGADYEAAVWQHRFDLLYLHDALAGLIETIDEGDGLLIENVAVAPDFQRRGLGARLVSHAENIARALGYSLIRLYTNERFAENIVLYQRLGFKIDSRTDVGGATVRVDMSKLLAKEP